MAAEYVVVLHLGAHKTGTSLIQKYLRDRPAELARMRLTFLTRTTTNEVVGWGMKPLEAPERLRDAVRQAAGARVILGHRVPLPRALPWIAGGAVRTVVVSHENALGRPFVEGTAGLYPRAEQRLGGIVGALQGHRLRLVYYLRSQAQFLESYYLQMIHQGSSATFREWLSDIDLDAISWAPLVETLAEAVGHDNLVVKDFAEIKRGQNRFLEDFLRTCDHRLDPHVDYPDARNRSVSDRGLKFALAMNPWLETEAERKAARVWLQTHFNNTTGPRPVLLSDAQIADLRERYDAENAALLNRFGDRGGGSE